MNKEERKKEEEEKSALNILLRTLKKKEHHGNLTCSAPDLRDMMHIQASSLALHGRVFSQYKV